MNLRFLSGWMSALLLVGIAGSGVPNALAQGKAAESKNMELVGYNDLQGRPAYQPSVNHQGNRWIAYIGLHGGIELNPLTGKKEGNGTMVVDVTDPRKPVAVAHIPGDRLDPEKVGMARMATVCNIAGGTYLIRPAPNDMGTRIELWNVTDPAHPTYVNNVVDGLKETHKFWWECDTGIAYLTAWDTRWRARGIKIYDMSKPDKPVFIRDFGLVGQEPGSKMEPPPREVHGPLSYNGKVYIPYGTSRAGVIQVNDRAKLLKKDQPPTPQTLLDPQIGRMDLPPYWGAHTAYPLIDVAIPDYQRNIDGRGSVELFNSRKVRDFLVVPSEAMQRCRGPEQVVLFVDITDPTKPVGVSNFQVPSSTGNFCDRPGRFGPHSVQESFNPIYYKKLLFVAYFNAGLRVVDIRNPFRPTEVGYYIPAVAEKAKPICEGANCRTGIETNNAELDDRGWIYIVDRAGSGMHILQVTGEARAIANSTSLPK